MSPEAVQVGILALLSIIVTVAILALVMIASSFRALRLQQDATNRILASKDLGPALNAVVQQTKQMNLLLANIDKRLEKLEALEKVQIANMSMRDDPRRLAKRL